jgi:transcriptional regulator with XRE-family HTH domain
MAEQLRTGVVLQFAAREREHGSGLGLHLDDLGKPQSLGRQALPSDSSLHAVCDGRRQGSGPLTHSLGSDADLLGGQLGRAPEQLDGGGFVHDALKHASSAKASMLARGESILSRMEQEQEPSTFADRLKQAMGPIPRDLLAKELGISVQAIAQVLKGTTRAMTAENTAVAARFLGVNWFWLATGEGSPTTIEVAPEETDLLSAIRDIRRLNPETHAKLLRGIEEIAHGLRTTDNLLRAAHGVKGYVTPERAAATLPPSAAPKPDQSKPADQFMGGMSGFGELVEEPKRAGRKG